MTNTDENIQPKGAFNMTEEQINYMTYRFLGWRLPKDFHPDCGISFQATFNHHLPEPMRFEPNGTNLFDASQAKEMVRYMVEGMPITNETGLMPREMAEQRAELLGALRQCKRELWHCANQAGFDWKAAHPESPVTKAFYSAEKAIARATGEE